MRALLWIIVTGFVTGLICALVLTGRLPLGVPGQWEWGKLDQPNSLIDWFAPGVILISYIIYAWLGARWAAGGPWLRSAAVMGLVCAGIAAQMGMQQAGLGLGKWPFVLYSPSSSGYYTAAKRDVQSARQFVAEYDQIQEKYRQHYGPLHLATHPPGLVLLQYATIRLCEASPAFTRCLLRLQPQAVASGFAAVAPGASLPPADQAAIWLLALLSQFASGLTVLPIYYLARRGSGPLGGWFAAALWPLVPAVTIFMPKSDVLYPLFAATCVGCMVTGSTVVGRCVWGLAAGTTLWIGMFLSFGMISVAPLAVLATALAEGTFAGRMMRGLVERLAGLVIAMSVASIALWAATGHWLPATWWRCYRVHATFYDPGQIGANRTYWPWIGFNLAEFVVATGIPLMAAAITGTAWLLRARAGPRMSEAGREIGLEQNGKAAASIFGVVIAWWLTLLALDLSGKNLGEIARLWMFLMPFACVAAAPAIDWLGRARWPALLLLVLQATQTATFAASVQGFYDPSSIQVDSVRLDFEGGPRLGGKRQRKVRAKFFDDARGSATDCAACLDAIVATHIP